MSKPVGSMRQKKIHQICKAAFRKKLAIRRNGCRDARFSVVIHPLSKGIEVKVDFASDFVNLAQLSSEELKDLILQKISLSR